MKTDADGKILMDDAHKISGDAFYKDVDGMVCLPLGTITVQEVVPPKGYLLDPTIFVQKLEEKNVMSTHFNSFKYFVFSFPLYTCSINLFPRLSNKFPN